MYKKIMHRNEKYIAILFVHVAWIWVVHKFYQIFSYKTVLLDPLSGNKLVFYGPREIKNFISRSTQSSHTRYREHIQSQTQMSQKVHS